MYPKIKINVERIKHNADVITNDLAKKGISVSLATKLVLADINIIAPLLETKIKYLTDSRILNLKKLKDLNIEKWLIRSPMICEIQDVIKYANTSLNSELKVIKLLNEEARKQNKIHNIILMFDLGDLREGYFYEEDLFKDLETIITLKNINIQGIGTNLTCYGGIIPTKENLTKLVEVKERIENKFKINLEIVSGGNSSSYYLALNNEMPKGINNLRLGELIFCARETSFHKVPSGLKTNTFTLETQIIELKTKPSIPIGEVGFDSFGNKPKALKNKGLMKRAIVAIGKQDIFANDLSPDDKNIEILGLSSDHMLLDVTNSKENYEVGDIISFDLSYGDTLALMDSDYVEKEYIFK